MTETSAIMIPDESALVLDTSCIDVSEVENQEDRDFLVERGTNILKIVAAASLKIGYEVHLVQTHFNFTSGKGQLTKFYTSLGIKEHQAQGWAAKFRLFMDDVEKNGNKEGLMEAFENTPTKACVMIDNLPKEKREGYIEGIHNGDVPTTKEVLDVSKEPQTKLEKAEEALFGFEAKKAEAETKLEDADAASRKAAKQSVERVDASIERLNQEILDLKAEIEEEKVKTTEEAEAKKQAEAESARLEKELQKLKFDDAKVRAERVKKLSSTLTVSVPQVTADVLKFFAEIKEYPEDVQKHVYENCRTLADQIADRL